MLFRQIFHAESGTYTYLLADAHEAVLIDPVLEQADMLSGLLEQLGVKLVVAIDTHTHADHITALGTLRDRHQCATRLGEQSKAECISESFRDGEAIQVGQIALRAMYTPGHTDDSYSFYVQQGEAGYVFTGDTLLIRGTGRTDFQNGNAEQQYDSLFERLLALPEQTLVYPGHDYKGMTVSTIGEEKRFNPRLQVPSKAAYVALMNGLNLPNPKLMDVAVPANLACGKAR